MPCVFVVWGGLGVVGNVFGQVSSRVGVPTPLSTYTPLPPTRLEPSVCMFARVSALP